MAAVGQQAFNRHARVQYPFMMWYLAYVRPVTPQLKTRVGFLLVTDAAAGAWVKHHAVRMSLSFPVNGEGAANASCRM